MGWQNGRGEVVAPSLVVERFLGITAIHHVHPPAHAKWLVFKKGFWLEFQPIWHNGLNRESMVAIARNVWKIFCTTTGPRGRRGTEIKLFETALSESMLLQK